MAAASSYRPVLLIVEDDDLLREAIASVLAHTDCEVVVTASGEEALALIAEIGSFDGLYTWRNRGGCGGESQCW